MYAVTSPVTLASQTLQHSPPLKVGQPSGYTEVNYILRILQSAFLCLIILR